MHLQLADAHSQTSQPRPEATIHTNTGKLVATLRMRLSQAAVQWLANPISSSLTGVAFPRQAAGRLPLMDTSQFRALIGSIDIERQILGVDCDIDT